MKKMYYNPIEMPVRIKIVSKCFNVDVEYIPEVTSHNYPCHFDDLFLLAYSSCFDEVAVYVTEHEQAYIRKTKNSPKEHLKGWVSLKGVVDGGGYLNDKSTLN